MTTTETPSVDEARRAIFDRCDEAGVATRPLVDAFEAAVRAEAIRERDEAIALLRRRDVDPDVTAVDWVSALVADVQEAMRTGDWLHDDPRAITECLSNIVLFVEAARSFLARFPEGGEG